MLLANGGAEIVLTVVEVIIIQKMSFYGTKVLKFKHLETAQKGTIKKSTK
jgi:hypothetical protein